MKHFPCSMTRELYMLIIAAKEQAQKSVLKDSAQ
jgi:hypothetical protein